MALKYITVDREVELGDLVLCINSGNIYSVESILEGEIDILDIEDLFEEGFNPSDLLAMQLGDYWVLEKAKNSSS
ncbi:hypothetical protein GCM10007216_18660 [Thalassobacillus devorans]|uniref:Uncharacterized protein n=1 Tax=Thalassobacillus devorans TaxID=279813 RepID=A0ABQ1P073_9BACI|nr:hypothetical protein [Thalassobacillus devorans]NIK28191.1 hypothetical protein [Thalassobacillus devorans]GGC88191.1 hypothetical protein GCM10007216_18660 [Thalassobacillus devorans]